MQETGRFDLLRRPAKSGSELRDARLRPDMPGVYLVRCTVGGRWTRELELCAARHADLYGSATASKDADRRLTMRGWLNDPERTSPDDVINRLERNS